MSFYGTTTANYGGDQWYRVGLADDYSVVGYTYIPDYQIEVSAEKDWNGDSAVGEEGQRGEG